jgi:acetoacetyl-CoA synthetase
MASTTSEEFDSPSATDYPAVLSAPTEESIEASRMGEFRRWLSQYSGRDFQSYGELWQWSVTSLDDFWSAIWDFFDLPPRAYKSPVVRGRMPSAEWFSGEMLNYAEVALRRSGDDPAVIARSEARPDILLSGIELRSHVENAAAGLRSLGVGPGDRVAGILPNIPEALVAFLATASLGAIWSVCAPELGSHSIVERFGQIGPKVLFACNGYRYGGRGYALGPLIDTVIGQLPSLTRVVLIDLAQGVPPSTHPTVSWQEFLSCADRVGSWPVPVAFNRPLWILYSSGTTGPPKAIVQSHGGIVLEHLKLLGLHFDLRAHDRFLWYTTTGWTMWNIAMGGRLIGSAVVMFDGHPSSPDPAALWKAVEELGATVIGISPGLAKTWRRQDQKVSKRHDTSRVRTVGITGAPLEPDDAWWLHETVGSAPLIGSVSGGTDVCTGFVGPSPLLPAYSDRISGPLLGIDVEAWDPTGQPLRDRAGELVIRSPMPSMPIGFWGDENNAWYRASYFQTYPGVWRHGDWFEICSEGGSRIHGRSDATLNRGGVRIGTAEFYRLLEQLDVVADSVVVNIESRGKDYLLLFVVATDPTADPAALVTSLRAAIRTRLSPRHVPDEIFVMEKLPHTLNGKKLEVPLKRVLQGVPVDVALSSGAVDSPSAVDRIVEEVNQWMAEPCDQEH